MKLSQLTRIVEEDFPQESRALVQKLATALNPFLEQISQAMSKNIDYDNLNRDIITYTISVNSSGIPIDSKEIKHNLKSRPKGLICLSARNVSGNSNLPTGTPFITFDFSTNNPSVLVVKAIAGLPADTKFELVLEVIG